MPHTFRDGETLCPERLNESFLHAQVDLDNVMDQRYTYSQARYNIRNIDQADSDSLRSFSLQTPLGTSLQIVGVELIIYTNDIIPWTISAPQGAPFPAGTGLKGLTSATTNPTSPLEKSYAAMTGTAETSVATAAGLRLMVSAESPSVIESGHIIVHFRSDRATLAPSYFRYTPLQLNSISLDAKTPIENTIDNIDAALTSSQVADQDMRVHAYSERNFPIGSRTWRIPATQRRFIALHAWVIADPAAAVVWAVTDEVPVPKYLVNPPSGGIGSPPTFDSDSSIRTQTFNDPEDDTRDWKVHLTVTGGTAALTYCVLYST